MRLFQQSRAVFADLCFDETKLKMYLYKKKGKSYDLQISKVVFL